VVVLMKTRPITAIDRMLAWSDSADRATGGVPVVRRRTHRRIGQLDLVVVEQDGSHTIAYLSNDEGVIVEASATALLEAADVVRDLLAKPPVGSKRRRRT
jgi:hypothetical protein